MRRFAIFYNDGSVVYGGGEDDELVPVYFSRKWLEAPSDGVSHIAMEHSEVGRTVLKENDAYFMLPYGEHGDGYIGASQKLDAYLRQALPVVKFGGWINEVAYKELARRANTDPWVPRISGKMAENDEEADK